VFSRRIDTHDINEIVIQLPWEDSLQPGPVDDYLEVVDVDPASRRIYPPVDLGAAHLLAQDGLPLSEGDPRFHQQMTYAVARTTIQHFERALGRKAQWSTRKIRDDRGRVIDEEVVQRLRIYPHALREPNAFYSPDRKALLFGYFPASSENPGDDMPHGTVFTCLSHDIVAHETSHALLDGIHPRFIEPSNVDVWALHEAFADIVALFQHFTYPEVLKHQIARTRGNLERQNLLSKLAVQFGQGLGRNGALRDAIGKVGEHGEWTPHEPSAEEFHRTREPHRRGAILVAAVFDAFLAIYKRRTADLLRIASAGSRRPPDADLHPDLVDRLAQEAAKTATHILHICVRALDYCPPVHVDFGDYLRAIITADADMVEDDRFKYRLALIESFRERGIYPAGVRNMSEDMLRWQAPSAAEQAAFQRIIADQDWLENLQVDWGYEETQQQIHDHRRHNQRKMHGWFSDVDRHGIREIAHLQLDTPDRPRGSLYCKRGRPTLEVASVRPAHRIGPRGKAVTDLVVEMIQRRRGYRDPEVQDRVDRGEIEPPAPDFVFRGGCTLLIDPARTRIRYGIYHRILSESRLARMRDYLYGSDDRSLAATYFGGAARAFYQGMVDRRRGVAGAQLLEPFAMVHRSFGDPGE